MAFMVSKEVQARVWAARDSDTAFLCCEQAGENVVLCCVTQKLWACQTAGWHKQRVTKWNADAVVRGLVGHVEAV